MNVRGSILVESTITKGLKSEGVFTLVVCFVSLVRTKEKIIFSPGLLSIHIGIFNIKSKLNLKGILHFFWK